ncbi:MAG: signal peptidase I [Nanoarchaeota archaeon]
MEFRNTALFVLIFALGVVSASLIYEVGKITSETPLSVVSNPVQSVTDTFTAAVNGRSVEKNSPGDHINEKQIKVYNDKIELDIQNAIWSRFTDTNSMDPFLDSGSNGIEVIPNDISEIKVGDIVSYASKDGGIVIHRVIEINSDENGTYFIIKGDNNPIPDNEKVRFNQIKGILVGIIY